MELTTEKFRKQRMDFAKSLFEDLPGMIEVREIGNGKANQIFLESWKDFESYNPPASKNVYVGVFTRKRRSGKRADVSKARVLWLDFDNEDKFYSFEYLVDIGKFPQPSMIINSGHGKHIYYRLEQPAGREIEPVLKELARKLEADSQAAELARIMRLPGSYNVKDDPVKCEILKVNNNAYKLDDIAELLGVEVKSEAERRPQEAAEALEIDYQGLISKVELPCIKSILEGVEIGERNWLLGRLTKHLKNKVALPKHKAQRVVRVWNLKNEEPQNENELLASFNDYWKTDYNLEGCKVLDKNKQVIPDKQQILNKYCDKKSCPYSIQFSFSENESIIEYNNRLMNKIKNISTNSLIVYGILAMNKAGLTADRGAEIMGVKPDTFRARVNELIKLGFARCKPGIKQRGIKDLFYMKRQGTFGTGRTLISYAAVRLFLSEIQRGRLQPRHFKTYMLLRYIEYKSRTNEVYPSTITLAEKLGTSRSRVSKCINRLEQLDFIEIDRSKYISNLYKFKIR